MVTTLIESGAKRKRSKAGLAASIAIHGALVGLALTMGGKVAASTLEKPKAENIEFVQPKPAPEPEKVYVAPKKAAPKPAAPKKAAPAPRVRAPEPPKQVAAAPKPAAPAPAPINVPVNVPVITTPTVVPNSIPAIDPNALETASEIVARASDVAAANAAASGAKGSGDGRVTSESGGDVGVSRGDGSAWGSDQVDREVQPIGGASPQYPDRLRSAGLEGTVVLRFVVGANGRVEMNSVKVLDSPHDAFTDAVKTALRRMRFRAAEVRGTKVRQLVEQSFTFRLDR
jgi:protein TonB